MDKFLQTVGLIIGLLRIFFVRLISSGYYMIFLLSNVGLVVCYSVVFSEEALFSSILFKIVILSLLTHGVVGCIHVLHDYIFDRYVRAMFSFLVWFMYFKIAIVCIFSV